ncbi:hypothetical protein B0T16DRAFT_449791 [Cercophora newfieldiana]|uniref:AA1-like domain-containing protein n=1 Tax=Cercophora newfieldiana TaxID=92897 RepID=A0AA39XSH9_9PEZI|nr:hypothetical protein B0T16DRAFT_449791 [Cercophora newfieldiana]
MRQPPIPTSSLLLLSLLPAAQAAPSNTRWHPLHNHAALPICTDRAKIPNLFSLSDLRVTYTDDETLQQGNALFTLTNTHTRRAETLRCELRYNYNCEFLGTLQDRDARIWLQTDMATGGVTLTIAMPWGCDGSGSRNSRGRTRASVTGKIEARVECPQGYGRGGECRQKEGREVFGAGEVVMDRDGGSGEVVLGKKREDPPFPMTGRWNRGREEWWKTAVVTHPILGMARRGRAMAKVLAKGGEMVVNGEGGSEQKGKGERGKQQGGDGERKSAGKEKEKEKARAEEIDEKKFIDQVEHRLCSPSCLREARPEPSSGSRYTNGFRRSS